MYGYYKGVTSPVIGVSIQNAFLFGIQRFTRTYLDQSITGEFLAGTFTGALQTVLSSPVEMTKIRLQMQNVGTRSTKETRKYKGPVDVLLKMYSEEGIRGPGRGYLVTLIRDAPGYGFYFASYAWMCQALTPKDTSVNDLSIPRLLLAGGVCGAGSWVVIYPIDIIKTRVQAEGFQPVGRYRNYAHCVRECLEEGGLRTFTRGLNTTVIRSIPVNAVTFCTVSVVERHFKRLHKKDE